MTARLPISQLPPVDELLPDAALAGSRERPIGDILRTLRSLSEVQIAQVLGHQRKHKLRFGQSAVALRLATQDDVTWALSQQFGYAYRRPLVLTQRSELFVANDPFGAQAEAVRDLRSHLITQAAGERRPLAVLSPAAGEGRSHLAANLAVAFSQLGGSTLLIDADLRAGRQHHIFGVDTQVGLSNLLAQRGERVAVQRVADLPSLYILPVGLLPPNPLELLQRGAFRLLLDQLASRFDQVIIDTPAMQRGADARVVAAACGHALALGRKGRTEMSALRRLVHSVDEVQARMAGVVINDF